MKVNIYFNLLISDINECDEGKFVCSQNEICQNNDGSYDCICNPGYERSKDLGCIGKNIPKRLIIN